MRLVDSDSNLLIGLNDLNDVTIETPVNGQLLSYVNGEWVNVTIAGVGAGEALTGTSDTNVTLTLGGTPATALLEAVSLTIGWTGQLAVARGGTGASAFGGTNTLLYTTAANTISSITTTANRALVTDGTGVPGWGLTLPTVVQDTITRLGTIVSGVWSGTPISLTTGVSGDLPFSSIAQLSASRLAGRGAAGAGDIEEISVTGGLEFSTTNLQIANSGVTLAKIANIATARILGRTTAGSGVVEELTGAQAGALHTLGDHSDVGTTTPTKGNVIVGNGTTFEHLTVGANNLFLMANSAQTLGVQWSTLTVNLRYSWLTDFDNDDPGTATVKANNASLISANAIYISETDGNGLGTTALLNSACQGTSLVRGQLWFFDIANPMNFVAFDVTGALVDNGGWDTIPVSLRDSGGTLTNGASLVLYVLRTGDKGDTGATGATGAVGPLGPSAAITFTFDGDTTDSDPGSGKLKINDSTYSLATLLFVDDNELNGGLVEPWLQTFSTSTNTALRGTITLKKRTNEAVFAIFNVNAAVADGTGYWRIPVVHVTSNGALSGEISMTFSRTGNQGAAGAGSGDVNGPAVVVDNHFVLWDGTDGTLIKDGGAFTAATIPFAATGAVSSTNIQAAIAEVDAEKAALAGATFTGAIQVPNTGLRVLDTNASHYLQITPGSDLTDNRLLTITTGDAARTLDISAADVTISTFGASLIDDAAASNARTTLGLAIGTNVQAFDTFLDLISTLTDPAADRILFWDDSATGTEFAWLDLSGLTITGTTLAVSAASTTVSGKVEFATTAEYLANTASLGLSTDQVNAAGTFFALTDGASIAWDMASGFNASVTLAGNRQLANPTNPIVGRTGMIKVTQDGTGSRTLSYGTNWEAAGGTFPVLTLSVPGAVDYIFYIVSSSTSIVITGILKAVA